MNIKKVISRIFTIALCSIFFAAPGWEKANCAGRERLAKIWVGKELPAFAEMPYQQISAVTTGDEIKVTVSINRPAGQRVAAHRKDSVSMPQAECCRRTIFEIFK